MNSRSAASEIKNLIFDLGGVLLNIDYERTIVAFENLGFRDFKEHFTQYAQLPMFDKFEKGEITGDQFIEELQKYIPTHVNRGSILRAWNAMLLDFPEENIRFLQNAGKKYRLFLLSNTNVIHLRAFNNLLKMQYSIEGLQVFFNKVYFSHEIGFRKPEPEAYKLVLEENRLIASETLFLDDNEINLEGAASVGIQTYHKPPQKSWQHFVENFGLEIEPV